MSDITPISDLLKWQADMDAAPASINMRGCARFWMTAAERMGRRIWINGSPDISAVAIEIEDGVVLLLESHASGEIDGDEVHVLDGIDYRFAPMSDIENFMEAEDWRDTVFGQLKNALGDGFEIREPGQDE